MIYNIKHNNGLTIKYSNSFFRELLTSKNFLNQQDTVNEYESEPFFQKSDMNIKTYTEDDFFNEIYRKVNIENINEIKKIITYNKEHFSTILHLLFSNEINDLDLKKYNNNDDFNFRKDFLLSLLKKDTISFTNGFNNIINRTENRMVVNIDFSVFKNRNLFFYSGEINLFKTYFSLIEWIPKDIITYKTIYDFSFLEQGAENDNLNFNGLNNNTNPIKETIEIRSPGINNFNSNTSKLIKVFANKISLFYSNDFFINRKGQFYVSLSNIKELFAEFFLKSAKDKPLPINDYNISMDKLVETNIITETSGTNYLKTLNYIMEQNKEAVTSGYNTTTKIKNFTTDETLVNYQFNNNEIDETGNITIDGLSVNYTLQISEFIKTLNIKLKEIIEEDNIYSNEVFLTSKEKHSEMINIMPAIIFDAEGKIESKETYNFLNSYNNLNKKLKIEENIFIYQNDLKKLFDNIIYQINDFFKYDEEISMNENINSFFINYLFFQYIIYIFDENRIYDNNFLKLNVDSNVFNLYKLLFNLHHSYMATIELINTLNKDYDYRYEVLMNNYYEDIDGYVNIREINEGGVLYE